jgi:AAA domain
MTALKQIVERSAFAATGPGSPPSGSQPFSVFTTDQPAELSAREYVIDRLIERENIIQAIGYPGSGKSNLVMDMLASVAVALPWFGHSIEPGQSTILFAPERPKEMKRRLRAFEQHHQVDVSAFGIVSDDIDFAHGDHHARRVIATVRDHEQKTGLKAGLIAFDTVFDLLAGGDENHPRDMGSVSRQLQHVRRETNTPIVAVCHPSMERPNEPRGHKSSLAKADLTIIVSADSKTDLRRWQVRKANGLEIKPKGVFTLKAVQVDRDTAPVVVPGGAQAPAGSREDVIRQLIANAGGQIVMSDLSRAARETDQFRDSADEARRVAIDRLVKTMVADGKAEISGNGKARQARLIR